VLDVLFEGFACSVCVLYGGCKFFKFLFIKTPDSELDPDPYPYPDPQLGTYAGSGSGSASALNQCGSTALHTGDKPYTYLPPVYKAILLFISFALTLRVHNGEKPHTCHQ
jgi:hypothetical protein